MLLVLMGCYGCRILVVLRKTVQAAVYTGIRFLFGLCCYFGVVLQYKSVGFGAKNSRFERKNRSVNYERNEAKSAEKIMAGG